MPSYPDISDYTDSVQNAASQVIDPVLRKAKPRLKGSKPEMMSGGCAVVYPFQDGGDIFAVKCWLRDIGDLRVHYRLVESFLSSCQSTYFVGFAYVEKGIIAKDQIWPFLRMKWVGGKSILEFVSANVFDGPALVLLGERYLTMSQRLHKLGVAHGDLQGSNIKVVGSGAGIDFQLIDYDTLIVPSVHGRKAEVSALPSYQHPKRGDPRYYSGKEDYFSELVIYLSLLAVAENPSLWSKYPKGDPGMRDEDRHDKDMLFVKEDFVSERPTEVFKELYALSPLVRNLTIVLWNFTRKPNIDQLLSLKDVVQIAQNFGNSSIGARASSAFEELLSASSFSANAWLDDSDFVPRTHVATSNSKAQSFKQAVGFEEFLSANKNHTEIKLNPSLTRSVVTAPPLLSMGQVALIISIFMILIVVGFMGKKEKTSYDISQPAVSQTNIYQVQDMAIKQSERSSNEEKPLLQHKSGATSANTDIRSLPLSSNERETKLKARLAWKGDLQRRQKNSDSQFADLARRFSLGVRPADVDSYNAEVKAAEKVREEIEIEIINYNYGLDAPIRIENDEK